MEKLFSPKSIAVIGASANPEKLGNVISKNIIQSGYKGSLFLVNPREVSILDQHVFSTVAEISQEIDLSIVVIPAQGVLKAVEQVGLQKQSRGITDVSYIVVISSGFKEVGEVGVSLEKELVQTAKKYNIKIVGPNCLGVMNLSKEPFAFNGTFDYLPLISGNISLVSQSGALISAVVEEAQSLGFGFNKIVSLGNKSDVDENDLLEFLDADPNTQIIALYLESYTDGQRIYNLLQHISKPVVILKSGRTEVAKTAASSHTGSIAGNEKVAKAFLDNTKAIQVFSLDEFFDTLNLFRKYQNSIAIEVVIITNAGGLGVVALDSLADLDLTLAKISAKTESVLRQNLPLSAGFKNPVDVLGDAGEGRYEFATTTLLENQPNSGLLVILTPQVSTDVIGTAKAIIRLVEKYPKNPILPVFIGGEKVSLAKVEFIKEGLPSFESPERALKSLNNLYGYQTKQATTTVKLFSKNSSFNSIPEEQYNSLQKLINKNKETQNKILDFYTVVQFAKIFDLKLPKFLTLNSQDDLEKVFKTLGTPVVIKSVQTDLLHRTEKKGVITGVDSVDKIKDFLNNFDLKDVIFQESVEKGLEVFTGINNDTNFGQVLVVGTGGIYAEAMDDFALAPLPQTIEEVKAIFKNTKLSKILDNYRNTSLNSTELYSQVLNICLLAKNFPDILSIDANPIIVTDTSSFVVDLKLSLI